MKRNRKVRAGEEKSGFLERSKRGYAERKIKFYRIFKSPTERLIENIKKQRRWSKAEYNKSVGGWLKVLF